MKIKNFLFFIFIVRIFVGDAATLISTILPIYDASIPFERVITLGDHCQTKFQINFYFEKTHPGKAKDYTGGSHIFDWVKISNLDLLASAFSNKLEGVCDERMDVKVSSVAWSDVEMHAEPIDVYGIRYSHLFDKHPLIEQNTLNLNGENILLNKTLFDSNYSGVRDIVEYKKNKLINNTYRTMYIHYASDYSRGQITDASVKRLRDSICVFRGDSNFVLHIVSNTSLPIESAENITFSVINNAVVEVHKQLDPAWEELLNTYSYAPAPHSERK